MKPKASKLKLPPLVTVPLRKPRPRGFAAMKKADVLKIAALGGKTISKDRRWMQELGARGGRNSHLKTNGRQSEK
jgi:general stress protein YciG